MSPTLILDCSVVMAWCFEDERTPQTDSIQDQLASEAALAPGLLFLEVVNVLAMAEKRNRISSEDSTQFLQLLSVFDIQVDDDPQHRALTKLPPLCRRHSLTSYDAVYLELAIRTGLPLATLDDSLRRAAKEVGLLVLGK